MSGGSHTPAYLAINPTGRTPSLVDGDFKLWESTAIMQYIASQKPNSLWPNDARAQADIARWQSWQLAHFSKEGCEPLIFNRLVKKLLNLGPPDEASVARGLEAFNKEPRCSTRTWPGNPIWWARRSRSPTSRSRRRCSTAKEAELPLGPYARIQDWFGRVSALPCWREAAPQRPAAAA